MWLVRIHIFAITFVTTVVAVFAYCSYQKLVSQSDLLPEEPTAEERIDAETHLHQVVPVLIESERDLVTAEFSITNPFSRPIDLSEVR